MRTFVFFLLFSAFSFFSVAQSLHHDVIASDGNYLSCPAGSVSFTIGEPVSDSYLGTKKITKGFQQPKAIITSIPVENKIGGSLLAYPNPSNDKLILDFSKMEKGIYSIALFDASGKRLTQSEINIESDYSIEKFEMKNYSNGIYLLKVANKNNGISQSFRILKQQ